MITGELVELALGCTLPLANSPNAQTFYTPGNMGQKIRISCPNGSTSLKLR